MAAALAVAASAAAATVVEEAAAPASAAEAVEEAAVKLPNHMPVAKMAWQVNCQAIFCDSFGGNV